METPKEEIDPMLQPANTILQARLSRWSRYLQVFLLLILLLVLVGWQFDIEWLKHPLPGTVAMNPVTAMFH